MSIPLFLSLCMQYSWDLTSHLLQSRMRRSRTKPYAHITPAAAPESCKRAARASPCQPGLVEINSASCPLPHLPAPGWVPHLPLTSPRQPLSFIHSLMRWYEQFHSAEFLSGCQNENWKSRLYSWENPQDAWGLSRQELLTPLSSPT